MLDRVVGDVLAGHATVANHPAAVAFPMGSAEAMIDLARRFGCDGDPGIRQRIANLYAVAETARVTALRAKAAAEAGRPPGAESSIGYLAGVKLARLSRDLGLAILGAHGLLLGDDSPDAGAVQLMALTSLCHGIQGGTEQIQRNIVGERVLGLPKEPQVDRDIPFRLLPKN
jgi:alkylation response protein AidB-like acyl-CoA dehydrogenase